MEIELGVIAFVLVALCGLLQIARLQLRKERNAFRPVSPRQLPPLAVIVPVTGSAPGMRECLGTIAAQDYPDYEVLFVTEDMEDNAVPAVFDTIARANNAPPCRHVVSGPAGTCGQKNHNLLAGIAAAGSDRKVFVFFDSSHLAPPNYLRSLLNPIAAGGAQVTTGYHHALPEDLRPASLGLAMTVLFLHIMQEIPRLRQPWGGSTAITRELFEKLNVAEVWATNVVDDVSLAMLLRKSGITTACVPGAMLSTPVRGETFLHWNDWLTRQWRYLKFCFPGSWIAAGIALYLVSGLVFLEICRAVLAAAGFLPARAMLPALFILPATAIFADLAARFHPHPGPRLKWLAALYATVFMGTWCHLRTLLTREIHWRDKTYIVGARGKILRISNH